MKQALKDLILSECPEDNALAVAILRRKYCGWKARVPKVIESIIFETEDGDKISALIKQYWKNNHLYPMGHPEIFKYNYILYD